MKLLFIAACLPLFVNAQTVQRMCTGCHPIDVVTGSRHTREQWQNIVQDMVARGALGSAQDIDDVVNYLAANYGQASMSVPLAAAAIADAPAAAKIFDSKLSVAPAEQWPAYGHDPGGQRYSPLKQITPENVGQLQRA